jgi:hypothetical protein
VPPSITVLRPSMSTAPSDTGTSHIRQIRDDCIDVSGIFTADHAGRAGVTKLLCHSAYIYPSRTGNDRNFIGNIDKIFAHQVISRA